MLKCCVTGPRPQSCKLYWLKRYFLKYKLKKRIIDAIKCGYTHFISGMALGVDILFAEIVIKLKTKNKRLVLECALPCINQCSKWKKKDCRKYWHIIACADFVTYVSKCNYYNGCMQKRNKYMVNASNRVICVSNNSAGTQFTYMYAKMREKEISLINIWNMLFYLPNFYNYNKMLS